MEYCYKQALGGYVPLKEGDDKHKPTHVLMEKGEYDLLQEKIRNLERAREKAIRKKEEAEDNMRDGIEYAEKQAEKKIKEARESIKEELETAIKEKEQAEALNVELKRIMTNRSNAKNGITPKKEHNGYIVKRSEQFEYMYRKDRKTTKPLNLWRTIIQTPVPIDMRRAAAQDIILDDFLKDYGKRLDFNLIKYNEGLTESIKEIEDEDWNKNRIALTTKLSQNTKTELWEITIIHNWAIQIPEEMRFPKKEKKK